MTVFVRSLVNYSQTIDSVALPAFALQERGQVTSALTTARDQRKIDMWSSAADVHATRSVEEYTPATGATLTLNDWAEDVLVTPAGTIATLTITMPAAPREGQRVTLAFDQVVTSLTQNAAAGQTLKGALTAATAKGFGQWVYRASNKTWYRVG